MKFDAQQVAIGKQDFDQIFTLIESYFDGLFHADTKKLRSIFHPDAELKAPGKRRTLETWLDDVATRAKPSDIGMPYHFKVKSIELIGEQAMVKVDCPLFEYQYVDFLGLLKEQQQWKIVNKMYTDTRN